MTNNIQEISHQAATGAKEAGSNFWKKDIAQRHNRNQLESNETKMADNTRPKFQSASEKTHSEVPWQFHSIVKRPRRGRWPKSLKSPLLLKNSWNNLPTHSVQFTSVCQLCPTLCKPMDCSLPDFPVHHQLPGVTQTYVHWVSDAINTSHLSSLSPPTFSLSKHQGLFQWVSSSHQVAKVMEFQLQHQAFQWIFRTDFLQDALVGSPCSPRDSQESSPIPQLTSINSLVLSFLYSPTLTSIHDCWKTIALTRQTFVGKVMSLLFHMLPRLVITWSFQGASIF